MAALKEKELIVVETMMDLMAGVRDSLKEVAGGIQALQRGQLVSQAAVPPQADIPSGAVYVERTAAGL